MAGNLTFLKEVGFRLGLVRLDQRFGGKLNSFDKVSLSMSQIQKGGKLRIAATQPLWNAARPFLTYIRKSINFVSSAIEPFSADQYPVKIELKNFPGKMAAWEIHQASVFVSASRRCPSAAQKSA